MAFVRGRSKTDDPIIASGGALAGSSYGSPAGGTPKTDQYSQSPGSGFVNIERYLTGNDPTKMGEAVGGKVAEKGETAKGAIEAYGSTPVSTPTYKSGIERPSFDIKENYSTIPTYDPALKATQDWQDYQNNLGTEKGLMQLAGGGSPINQALNAGMLMTASGKAAIQSKAAPYANISDMLKGAETSKTKEIVKAKEAATKAGQDWDKAEAKRKQDAELAKRQADIDAENKAIEDQKAAAIEAAKNQIKDQAKAGEQAIVNVGSARLPLTSGSVVYPGSLAINNPPYNTQGGLPVVNNDPNKFPFTTGLILGR